MSSFLTATSHLYGGNAAFIEDLFNSYRDRADSVPPEWQEYFARLTSGEMPTTAPSPATGAGMPHAKQHGVFRLIEAYRRRGFTEAQLDSLKRNETPPDPMLDPARYGLTEADMDTVFDTGDFGTESRLSLRDILAGLRRTYAGMMGVEFQYILETEQRRWLEERLEADLATPAFEAKARQNILFEMTAAETMERYLGSKYVGAKRFGLEGGESLIPAISLLIRNSAAYGVEEIVLGMAHRGRLNVLLNVLGKKSSELYDQFEGRQAQTLTSGDEKYHDGLSADVPTPNGPVHISLAYNPSHLEIVNPVVTGAVRARQHRRKDADRNQVMAVLIHGDSALSSLGVIQGTLNMSQTRGYRVGGTFHIVVNNQVGFTTSDDADMRSTPFCTDIAKMVTAPVFHVNGDDPELVCYATQVALEFRAKFKKDVFLDIYCFRKLGHNEADDPRLTQPFMYRKVASHPGARALYAKRLVDEKVISDEDVQQMIKDYRDAMDRGDRVGGPIMEQSNRAFAVDWTKYMGGPAWALPTDTSLPLAKIQELTRKFTVVPDGFSVHPVALKVLKSRAEMGAGEQPVDWGMAETLAYASLVEQGIGVRISGEDAGRGTFSHRHAVLHDQARQSRQGGQYVPLQNISADQAHFSVYDSILNEEAVLAYEYGYAGSAPERLVMWEAQYGDFANGAQVAIDQFIAASEAKWGNLNRLVVNLPHGSDGAGPEHSSARPERWLQLCAEANMEVVMPSCSAQMFHVLRRQMLRPYCKPLIIFMSKRLLRFKPSMSSLNEFTDMGFRPVIADTGVRDPSRISRIIFCSGQVYYDFEQGRTDAGLQDDVAIIRVESLYPFPVAELAAEIAKYPNAKEFVWGQEEPRNQGAWYMIRHRLEEAIDDHRIIYAGRPEMAAPAVGYGSMHKAQLEQFVADGLGPKAQKSPKSSGKRREQAV